MNETHGFYMTAAGRLPDIIRNRLANELPKYAGQRVQLTIKTYKEPYAILGEDIEFEASDHR